MDKLKLIAPNSLPIIGIKSKDGQLSDFEYSYDDKTQTRLYVLVNGSAANIEGSILIDSNGNEWDMADVEYHSLFIRR
jgi:hypothetical protein